MIFGQHDDNGDKIFQGVSCLLRIGRASRVVGIKQVFLFFSLDISSMPYCRHCFHPFDIYQNQADSSSPSIASVYHLLYYCHYDQSSRFFIHECHCRILGKNSNNNYEWNDANNNIQKNNITSDNQIGMIVGLRCHLI